MTATARAGGASPVDFAAFGDYGDFSAPGRKKSAEFVRPAYPFRGRITADGSSGYLAEPGRYHLYISWACPWAHRTAIVRKLLGLEEVISLSVVDPVRDGRGWAFREGDGHSIDPGTAFGAWTGSGAPELYPESRRPEIDAINEVVYENVNNGVYRSGFAGSQEQYHLWVTRIFDTLDELEQRLAGSRYLLGDAITEADIRLWVTLARFDAVYYSHFKANLRRLSDYPNLWGYARDLYSMPAFAETTRFDHIKRHYFMTHPHLNPSRIVPDGPLLEWTAAHDRADKH